MAVDVTACAGADPDGFVAFFRRYVRTWIHAVATAGLTAFGTLTVVHRGFAALAIGAYVLPPVALYLSTRSGLRDEEAVDTDQPRDDASGADAHRDDASGVGTPGPGGDSIASVDDRDRCDESAATAGGADGQSGTTTGWTTADVAVAATLLDAAVTPAAAWAVGEDGVVLVDRGDGWTVDLEDGPGAAANTLRGVDATGAGAAVWIAGDGGAVGRIDAESGRHVDLSGPDGITDSWNDVAVAGEPGDETVLLVNGSGEVVRGRYRDGEVAWTAPVNPGGGSSIAGVTAAGGSTAYLCDTNDGVVRTDDGGRTFRRVGVDGADGTLTGVAARRPGACRVSADDGVVHRYDGDRWTPERVDDGALLAVATGEGYAVATGEGVVHERPDGDGWRRTATPTSAALRGVAVGPDRAVAVGEDGTVVERRL